MSPTRREFLWTAGAAATATAVLPQTPDIFWTTDQNPDPGWAPGIEVGRASACLLCPARCGIRGRMVDGRLVRIMGNPLHPLSRGGVCPRGVAGVQMLYHPERLAAPMTRLGERGAGEWRTLTRDGAVGLIADRVRALREAGRPDRLALVAGYSAGTMEDLWRQFLRAVGSPNYVADAYDDGTGAIMAAMHGIPRQPSYDLDRAELVLSFGAPLFESWWSPLQAFVAFADPQSTEGPRARFVQVDHRFSRTAARAQQWVGVRPGTHATLALGIAYVLIRDELVDLDFLTERVSGFEDFRDGGGQLRDGYRSLVTRYFRTEEVSAITGVPVERITSVARAFAAASPAVAVCGSDVTQTPNGLLAGMAVHSLNLLVGSVNRPGGIQFGDGPPLAPLATAVLDQTARTGLERAPLGSTGSPLGDANQALQFAEAVAAAQDPGIEVLLLYYANPLASSTQPDVWRQALEKIPFVVSFSPFLDETTRYADLVLPDLLPYERWQDAPGPPSYPYAVWGLAQPLVEPHDGGTHTGDAILAVAQQLGGNVAESLPYESFAALLRDRARGLFEARRGMTMGDAFEREHHRQMEERGWWLPEHDTFDAFWDDLVQRGGWADLLYDDTDPARFAATRDGRLHLMPAAVQDALAGAGERLYADFAVAPAGATEDYPLRLIPYRVSTLASGTIWWERWLVEQPGLFPHVMWMPWVEVHPETAQELGLGDGTEVWVVSSIGRYRARLKVFPGIGRENLSAPYGLRHPDGELASPLQLLNGEADPVTGAPSWFTTHVRLERA
jgi:anaerobic selenocysteine-containing dehydrogenase